MHHFAGTKQIHQSDEGRAAACLAEENRSQVPSEGYHTFKAGRGEVLDWQRGNMKKGLSVDLPLYFRARTSQQIFIFKVSKMF